MLMFSHTSVCCLSVKESLVEEQSANLKKKRTLENLLVMVCAHSQLHPSTQHPLCDDWHVGDTMKHYTVRMSHVVLTCLFVVSFLQQADLKSAMAQGNEFVSTQYGQLQVELEAAKEWILRRVLKREEASRTAQQVLRTKFEVVRGWV